MKLSFRFLLLAASIACILASCSDESTDTPKARIDIPLSRAESEIVAIQNSFSLKFFNEALESTNGNFCVSPMRLSMALSILSNGANGNTRDEILDVLGFDNKNIDEVNAFNAHIVKDLSAVDNTTRLSLANSIWIDNSFKVYDSFISDNQSAYNAEIFTEALKSQNTMEKINSWCKTKTEGLIPQFLTEPLNDNSLIVILNALNFKGLWATPFDKANTKKGNFYNNGETLIQTDMMETEIECLAAHDTEGADWVSLAYGNGAFGIILVQPDHIRPGCVQEYFANISDDDFKEMRAGLSVVNMKLKMPRFDFETSVNLKNILRNMGIRKMFDGTGDFSKISDISLVFKAMQKSRITVDEAGTKAAATTSITGMITSPSPIELDKGRLTIDHPFAFFIYEVSTGAILFAGTVNSL